MVITLGERTRGWFRLAFWLALAFALTMAFLPRPPHLPIDGLGDKFAHVMAFLTLAALATVGYPKTSPWRIVWLLSLTGAGIELVQAIPGLHRDSDVLDWLADTLAVLAAVAVVRLGGWSLRAATAS